MNELFCSGSLKALQTLFVIYTCHFELSECFAKQVERYKDRLERIWSKGDTYVKSKRYMTNPILSECSLYIIAVPASRRSLTVKSNLNLEGRTVKYSHHMRPAKRAYSRKFSCISESANGIAISSEEVAILQSKKSTESQQLSDGHRQAVKKMVLNNVINVSKNSLLDTSQCDSAILIIALSIKMCSASSSSMNSSLEVSRGESLGESTIDVVEALKKGFDKMMVLSPSKEEHFDFKRDCTDLKENCTYIFMENFEQEDADFFLSLKEEDASAIRCSTPVNGDNNVSVELMDCDVSTIACVDGNFTGNVFKFDPYGPDGHTCHCSHCSKRNAKSDDEFVNGESFDALSRTFDREATMNNENVRNVGVYSTNELPLHIKSQLQIFKIIF
ncbi:hypothetical protein T08_11791 [Trichinella sp. T8]|nr:hypothetical protein T08_11791 [Trichinella sp. T8]